MARFGKPDKTGRSSGKFSGRLAKLNRPPEGEAWTWQTRDLIASPAWRAQSINCRRFVDCLMLEHMNHAGLMNGQLIATYDQLESFGCTRSLIKSAIDEAETLGLVRSTFRQYRVASEFALTWLPVNRAPASNDWKRIKEQKAKKKRALERYPI